MNKNRLLIRLLVLGCLLLLCGGAAIGQLVNLQLINGESFVKQAAVYLTTTSTVSAARGQILDRYGRAMVTNKTTFSLVLVNSAWEQEGQFERLLDLARKVQQDGGELQDVLPVSDTAPYAYTGDATQRATLSTYIKDSARTIGLTAVTEALEAAENTEARDAIDATTLVTPAAFIDAMRAYLETSKAMPSGLAESDVRTLVGVYYSMRTLGFSTRVNYTLATDISIDLIAVLKENHKDYAGVEIESEATREYDTTAAAHLLGTVGVMYATEWTGTDNGGPYQTKPGYNMSDIIGKTGLEAALESYLHGTAGSRTVQTTLGGDSLSEQTGGYAPEPGNNVVTTIDIDLQTAAEQSLADYVSAYGRGGAAVALDVNSGEVLAMASYPTYNLESYNKDYDQIAEDSRSPELNRATSGLYAPGSTFKVLTAIAALEEGVIDEHTSFTCTGVFEYGGMRFRCNNHEQGLTFDVTEAIKYSCNTFFYNVGRELTGAHLEKWCERFGLGQLTGIEVGETGLSRAAGPTSRQQMIDDGIVFREWQGGDDVTAAIGQSDNVFTPLQLCNYIAAVVNGGTLYKPTLVKNIKSYDYSEVIRAETPEVIGTIELSEKTRELVMTGMGEVTAEGGTAATTFADYPIKVGGKTGTAETNVSGADNGVFVAFAPFDDPQIAVCVVGEAVGHGSSVAPVVRNMFDAYFADVGEEEQGGAEPVQQENTLIA